MNRRLRDALVAGIIALVAGLGFAVPRNAWLDGLSLDLLFWLREIFAPAPHGGSSTVVIAIDEETYRREPFKDVPRAMWTPQLAKVMKATLEAGAKVIGFDVIYPTSIEPFIRGYEREWLLALRDAGRAGRLVLGKVQHQAEPIVPHVGAMRMVGEDNVRSLNAVEDDDGSVRRMPLLFRRPDGGSEPSFALELAQRARRAHAAGRPLRRCHGARERRWEHGVALPWRRLRRADLFARRSCRLRREGRRRVPAAGVQGPRRAGRRRARSRGSQAHLEAVHHRRARCPQRSLRPAAAGGLRRGCNHRARHHPGRLSARHRDQQPDRG